jgi:hypothetical protein
MPMEYRNPTTPRLMIATLRGLDMPLRNVTPDEAGS